MSQPRPRDRVYATNRRAHHDYTILETLEVGIVLTGTEIKSIRAGRANLREAYARVERGELWLHNAHLSPYEPGSRYNADPTRTRKLLAHTREIDRLAGRASEAGTTLVPLRLYDRKGYVKIELAVARGRRRYDKRAAIAKREAERQVARATKRDVERPVPRPTAAER